MDFTEELYRLAQKIWSEYIRHPFLQELGEGRLAEDKFRFFLVQDYLFLLQYTKVFALGMVKAEGFGDVAMFSEWIQSILHSEMEIHKWYQEKMNITPSQLKQVKPAFENQAYASYILWVAQNGGVEEAVTAALARSWSYSWLAEKLNLLPGASKHPLFGRWIQGYNSLEYKENNRLLTETMNRMAWGCSHNRLDHLRHIFVECGRWELKFWDMSLSGGDDQLAYI